MRLDQNVDHVAVLIHGAPQIPLLAVDSNEDFIQMPVVAQPSLSSLQSPSIVETELLTPLPDRFIGYDDAALGEKIFDIPETQAEAMISPHRIADDLGRETIAGVTRAITLHGTSVSGFVRKLTMPVEELEALSGKKRNARLEAIKAACQEYIQGPMLEQLSALLRQRQLRYTNNRAVAKDRAEQRHSVAYFCSGAYNQVSPKASVE